jgi:hypothetical protein
LDLDLLELIAVMEGNFAKLFSDSKKQLADINKVIEEVIRIRHKRLVHERESQPKNINQELKIVLEFAYLISAEIFYIDEIIRAIKLISNPNILTLHQSNNYIKRI